ncbi:MAG: diacylglycerol kinase [Motiliproteus sp.]|nr:diacylglycerol kinase [Motiliproteus sp.]MCW9051908.1 diacylglycerol kinase [Motiliproteus sp.]
MPKPGRTGITRIINATGYSFKGLTACWKNEAAFRQELMFCVVLLPLSFMVGQDPLETALLITTLFLVLLMELLNSAIEAVVDRIGHEMHDLSGRAKDIGSAAVFLALLLVVIVWGLMILKNVF